MQIVLKPVLLKQDRNRKSDPSAVTLFAIAKYLQVSVDDLYTMKTEEQIKNEREQEFFKRNIRYYVSTVENRKHY